MTPTPRTPDRPDLDGAEEIGKRWQASCSYESQMSATIFDLVAYARSLEAKVRNFRAAMGLPADENEDKREMAPKATKEAE